MIKLTTKQRAFLKSLAVNIDVTYHIGKDKIGPELIKGLDDLLEKREIVKIDVLKTVSDDIQNLAITVSERTNSTLVQIIGRKIVLYKESKENKKIDLKKLNVK